MPLSDSDKVVVKSNMRKLALFDTAYRFCDEIFDFDYYSKCDDEPSTDTGKKSSEDGWLDTPMTADQMLEVTSGFLSIVLSHHYQK